MRVGIVGSGEAGLACSIALHARADIVMVERLPVLGGEHWRALSAVVEDARRAIGVVRACALAIRWNGRQLLSVGPTGAYTDRLDALVIATGHRPYTRTELGLEGSRCAGVLPATVALHLLQHRVVIGRRPVVIGTTRWARLVAHELVVRGIEPRVLAPADSPKPAYEQIANAGITLCGGARPIAVAGESRVTGIRYVNDNGGDARLACDAIVLAHGSVPMRNVDGAIFAGARIVYAQHETNSEDEWNARRIGQQAADAALRSISEPGPPSVIPLRVAAPASPRELKSGALT